MTKIEWCDDTINPITGCTPISPGCQNCYAAAIAKRFWGDRKFSDIQFHPDRLSEFGKGKKRRKKFIGSMCDLFHPQVQTGWLNQIDTRIGGMDWHTYIILTKRAPDFKLEDEQKCMLGFNSAEEAKKIFHQHYNDKRFFKEMRIMPYEEFEKKVLATLHGATKKVATNVDDSDENRTSTGPTHNRVPGDYLGHTQSSLVGMRSIKGDDMAPDDAIDRMFRFHDEPTSTRVLDGNSASFPESPAV